MKKRQKGRFEDSGYFISRQIEEPLPPAISEGIEILRGIKGTKGKPPVLEVYDPTRRKYFFVIPRAELMKAVNKLVLAEDAGTERALLRLTKRM